MKLRKLFATSMIGLLLAGQVSAIALADTAPTTPAPTTQSTPSDRTAPASDSGAGSTPADSMQVTPPADPATPPATGADPATTGVHGSTGAPAGTTGAAAGTTGAPAGTTGAQTTTGAATSGPTDTTGKKPEWVFNTLTGGWEAADQDSFTWDATSGYWLSPKYVYDTRMGWYKIVPPADNTAATAPSYYVTAPTPPEIIHTPVGDFVKGSPEYNLAKSLGIIVDPAISLTGPNSTNNASLNNSNNALVDFTNIVKLANVLNSGATSGDANVSGNTGGGDASTGNAVVMANVVNLLNSVWNLSGGAVMTFVKNIFGNFVGDITLSAPDLAPANHSVAGGGSSSTDTTGPNSTNNAALTNSDNLKVNVANQGTIDNTIDLNANSGDANVTGNTKGGNASTGDASVALNLINMINSAISAGGGFVGILNVFGNFNGDVLFGDDFLNQVVQSGSGNATAGNGTTGPNSTNNSAINNTNNASLVTDAHTAINNDINAQAHTGTATDSGNNTGGSASTGDANTHSSVSNLSGQNVSGTDAVLVIVNVMGHWLGGIMSLPGNITSALLGSGDTSATNNTTGPNSNNNSAVNNTNNTDVTATSDMTINNHVKLNADSGDANVTGNTIAGNAKTGNANVLSSVANISNSALNLRRWFGILIINVFGDWTGAVGKNTAAGDAPVAAAATTTAAPATTAHAIVNTTSSQTPSAINSAGTGTTSTATNQANTASSVKVLGAVHDYTAAQKAATHATAFMFIVAAVILMLAAALAAAERKTRRA